MWHSAGSGPKVRGSSSQTRLVTPRNTPLHHHHSLGPWLIPRMRPMSLHFQSQKRRRSTGRDPERSPLSASGELHPGSARPGAAEARSRCLPRPVRLQIQAGPTDPAGPATARPRLPASCGASKNARGAANQSWLGLSGRRGSFYFRNIKSG